MRKYDLITPEGTKDFLFEEMKYLDSYILAEELLKIIERSKTNA
mgnify:CR=1 FL=1